MGGDSAASDAALDDEYADLLHEMNERRAEQDWCRVCGQVHEAVPVLEADWFARWEVAQAEWMAMARHHMREFGEQLEAGDWADPWWTKAAA